MSFDEYDIGNTNGKYRENRTKFHANENVSGDRKDGSESSVDHYERLRRYNGLYSGEWDDKNKLLKQDRLSIYDSFVGQLEFTPHQKRRGRLVASKVSAEPGNYTLEETIFSICVLVAATDGREYHPQLSRKASDDLFDELRDGLDLDRARLANCLQSVEKRVLEVGL